MAATTSRIPFARKVLTIAAGLFAAGTAVAASPGTPLGPAFTVLQVTPPASQIDPAVALNASGEFVAVWIDTISGGVYGRRFDSNATPLDDGFLIAAGTPGSSSPHSTPRVAMNAAGNFVVTWQDAPESNTGIARGWARLYSASGVPAGAAFELEAATSTYTQGAPAVAMDADGDFVIAWERASRTFLPAGTYLGYALDTVIRLGDRQVVAQRYDHNGVAQGARLTAGTRAQVTLEESFFLGIDLAGGVGLNSGIGTSVDVAMDPGGDFVIAWGGSSYGGAYAFLGQQQFQPTAGISTINARRYSAAGKSLDLLPETLDTTIGLSTYKSGPSLAMDAAGDYVVAWAETSGLLKASSATVYCRRFNAKALRQGAQIKVGTTTVTSPLQAPSVSADSAGDFVVAWSAAAGQANTSRYNADGAALGPALTVAVPGSNDFGAFGARVASDAAGNFVVAWQQEGRGTTSVLLRSYAGP